MQFWTQRNSPILCVDRSDAIIAQCLCLAGQVATFSSICLKIGKKNALQFLARRFNCEILFSYSLGPALMIASLLPAWYFSKFLMNRLASF